MLSREQVSQVFAVLVRYLHVKSQVASMDAIKSI